jgi:hypothetical protein
MAGRPPFPLSGSPQIAIPALSAITYGNNQFVAVGNNGTVATSSDATTWLLGSAGANNNLWGVAYGGNEFVGVGWSRIDSGADQGRVYTSPDGIVWTERSVSIQSRLNNVFYGANGFVAVGDNGAIVESGTNFLAAAPSFGPPVVMPGGAVELILNGLPGQTYSIQASGDLIGWSGIGSISITNPPGRLVDQTAAGLPSRFYRAVWP